MSAPLVGVLALQGDVREHLEMLDHAGARTCAVRRPAELDAVDAIVMPGGESTTMVKLARAFGLLQPLRARLADGLPGLGTCAGMILLADRIEGGIAGQETVGGLDVVVRRNAFGRQVDSFEADLDVVGFATPFHAMFIRAPWVERTGPGVEVVARVSSGPEVGRIVAVRRGSLLATSFHPEMTGDHRFHGLFLDLVAGLVAEGGTAHRRATPLKG